MEDVIEVYHRPHDPARPVVCVDEAGKQLIGDVREPLPVRVGSPAKEDSEYERHGTANLFMAFEPLAGRRVVVPSTRTCPSAGRNRVRTLAVPPRTYSCGCRAGWPSGCHDGPGWGTAWNGPASSSHQTARPSDAPSVYASSINFFWDPRPGR